ncbi:hypothetical protein HWV07_08995 [Natronomonas salina]|uniref:hypothetical protein n=1 Tax=Natronomonas salina TaxID=1710540 RepID=UPI0015B58E83|nr:hypothetical protein [Natronomonas salina]QLD89161.1 hypothetical protein HWV07_08995 [Natronomonas salina]
MQETLLEVEAVELSTVSGVSREMLLDSLPRFVHANGPVTMEDCVKGIAMPSGTAPSERARAAAAAVASGPVQRGLEWLVEQGYLDTETNEDGQVLYSATAQLDEQLSLEGASSLDSLE